MRRKGVVDITQGTTPRAESSQAMREGSGAGVDEGRRHPCSLRISISGQCWPYPSAAVSLWPEEVEDLDGKFWLPFPPPPVLVLVTAESFDWRAVRRFALLAASYSAKLEDAWRGGCTWF